MNHALDNLKSPGAIGTIAAVVTFALLARSLLSFTPPKPISCSPSIRDAPDCQVLSRLKEIYPHDEYPGGGYFHSPHGKTRYYVFGKDGPKVVLVNGLAMPAMVWRHVANALAEHHQVLVYDIWGRGYSDAPDVKYTTALYTTQLALLMQYLNWERAHVVGLSMGGGIAAAFAADHSHLVDRVALLAPAGLLQPHQLPRSMVFFSSPLVQSIVSLYPLKQLFQSVSAPRIPKAGKEEPKPPHELVVPLQTAALPGYMHALMSSLRNGPISGLEWAFIRLGSLPEVQVLHLHGTKDTVVPYTDTSEAIKAHVPADKLHHVAFDGADHEFCNDLRFAPLIVETLLGFLSG